MKVLMINSVCGIRSTGRICTDLAAALEEQGHTVKIAYGREAVPSQFEKYAVRIGNDFDVKLHGAVSRLFDASGFGSRRATKRFIEWVREYDPDIIHLHNIHGYYINIEILFDYLKTCGKKIIWTLHDCWAFTGHSAYCDAAGCVKWQTGCYSCPQRREYPKAFIDKSKNNWSRKKELFTNIPNMEIITPSNWLAELVKQSFLKEYPVSVIHNGIDTSKFKPTPSEIAEQYGLENKKIVLGVAAIWDRRKGLDDFVKLSELLPDDYAIVVIGVTEEQQKQLPKKITALLRTNGVDELVKWYSAASVFLNPTYEDNYPTTNLEAQACKTPVITYNTGGSPESAENFGKVVSKDVNELYSAIIANEFISKPADYTIANMVKQYMNLYLSKI